jgi:hypothetical protein
MGHRKIILLSLLAFAAPLSWGEVPDAFWEDNFNFPYLCVTTGTYETSVNDTGQVVANDNDSFIVRETGVTRMGETRKTSGSCRSAAAGKKDGGYRPEIRCEGGRTLEIWTILGTTTLSPFAETETLHGSTDGENFEPVARLRTGKCSPINQ